MQRLNEQKLQIFKDAKSSKGEEEVKSLNNYFSFLDNKAKLILKILNKEKEGKKDLEDIIYAQIASEANKKARNLYRSLTPDIAFEKETMNYLIDHDHLVALKFLFKKDMIEAAQSFCTEKLQSTTLNKKFYNEFLKSITDHIKKPSPLRKRLLESKIELQKNEVAKQIDPNTPVSVFVIRQINKQKILLNKLLSTLSDENTKKVISDHSEFLENIIKDIIVRAQNSMSNADKILDISFASISKRVNADFNNIKLPELLLANESKQSLKEVMKLIFQDKEKLKEAKWDKVASGVKSGNIDANAILSEAKSMSINMTKSEAKSIVTKFSGKEERHGILSNLKKMFSRKESPASKIFIQNLSETLNRRTL